MTLCSLFTKAWIQSTFFSNGRPVCLWNRIFRSPLLPLELQQETGRLLREWVIKKNGKKKKQLSCVHRILPGLTAKKKQSFKKHYYGVHFIHFCKIKLHPSQMLKSIHWSRNEWCLRCSFYLPNFSGISGRKG